LLCCTVDNKYDWHLENHFSQISTVPTWSTPVSYPTRSFEDFTSSFDPLAINHVNKLAIQKQSPISEGALDDAMERCHYESVVRSSCLGANLAPINANGVSIVTDANHLFIQKQSPISEGALDDTMERCHYESVVRSSCLGANLAPINANGVSIVIDANHLLIPKQSPISEGALDEAGRLSKSTSITLPSCVSSIERYDPESAVSSSYLGANLAPIDASNDTPIVIDVNQSSVQKQSPISEGALDVEEKH